MRERTAHTRGDDGGFTLVELLIVIVVLGVLAGIVVFGVANFKQDAVSAACSSDVKTVQTASDAYTARTGNIAADVTALVNAKYLKSAPGTTINLDANGKATPATAC